MDLQELQNIYISSDRLKFAEMLKSTLRKPLKFSPSKKIIFPKNGPKGILKSPINTKIPFAEEIDNIRSPDPVYREQLIPSNYDHDLESAIVESLSSYNRERNVQETSRAFCSNSSIKDPYNSIIEELDNTSSSIVEEISLPKIKKNYPEGLNLEIFGEILKTLQEGKYSEARDIVGSISNFEHMNWIKKIEYQNKTLRTMLLKNDPDAILCLQEFVTA
jgi:hypothetical protein